MRVAGGCCSAAGIAAFAKWIWFSVRFADAQMASLSDTELDEIERWLDVPDQQIFAWVNGMEPVPRTYDTPLFLRLRNFNTKGAV